MGKFFAVVVLLVVTVAISSSAFAEEKGAATAQAQGWEEFLATHEKVMADITELVRTAQEAVVFLSDFVATEKERLLEELRKDAEETAKDAREYEESRKEMFKAFEDYFRN